jgi:hypothetical protein
MQQLDQFLIFGGAVALLVATNVPATIGYLRFRDRLRRHLSDEELDRRGLVDRETGGLFFSFFVNRRYSEVDDAELFALGEHLRVQLAVGIGGAIAFIAFVAWFTSSASQ